MISVALCTYNGALYIEEQIKSILNQSKKVDEIIICDDGSTDDTVKIINKLLLNEEIEYKIIQNSVRKGVTKNFELALSICKGDFIFLSDQDDIWTYTKVEELVRAKEDHKEGLLFFTDALLVDHIKRPLGGSLWEKARYKYKQDVAFEDFFGLRFVTGATVAIRRELLDYAVPFPECWLHDAWLAIVASIFGEVVAIPNKTIMYRQHENNVIGVQRQKLSEYINYRRKNINQSITFRNTMKMRYSALLDRYISFITEPQIELTERCISFWEDTSSLRNARLLSGIRIILKNAIFGNYKRFNHGIHGVMVDGYILLLSQKDTIEKK